jgi:hypothetical protein
MLEDKNSIFGILIRINMQFLLKLVVIIENSQLYILYLPAEMKEKNVEQQGKI